MPASRASSTREWKSVDRTEDPADFVRYLDAANAEDVIQAYKRRMRDLLEPLAGARILDAGCGTGDDACAIARLVGPSGKVVGLDNSETMVAEARSRLTEPGLPVEFVVGDIRRLEFPDNSFDGVRCDRTLQHVEDPERALTELVRVVKRGRRVVVMDPDWETLALDATDLTTTRRIREAVADATQNGTMGRRHHGLFRKVGLVDVDVHPLTFTTTEFAVIDGIAGIKRHLETLVRTGTITAAVGEAWQVQVEEADRAGRFFATLTGFVVVGRKP